MAHFYGSIEGKNSKGNYGQTTRQLTAEGGSGHVRGWEVGGMVEVCYNEASERDEVHIYATHGSNGGRGEKIASFYKDAEGNIQYAHLLKK